MAQDTEEQEKEPIDDSAGDEGEENKDSEENKDESSSSETEQPDPAEDTESSGGDDNFGNSEGDSDVGGFDGVDDGGDESENPQELGESASLVFKGLSDATEGFENQEKIVESASGNLNDIWSSLFEEFKLERSKNDIEHVNPSDQPSSAIESVSFNEYGFSEVSSKVDKELRHMTTGVFKRLPSHFKTQFDNSAQLHQTFSSLIEPLWEKCNNLIRSGSVITGSYSFGAYRRYFMAGGVSIDTMRKLNAVSNQQLFTHAHLAYDGLEHFLRNAKAVLQFIKTAKSDEAWEASFDQLKQTLTASDAVLGDKIDVLIRKTDPTSYPPRSPSSIIGRKPEATGKALVSMFDSNYYCSHSPKKDITSLSQLMNYGVSIERDASEEVNPSTGIEFITCDELHKQLVIAKRALEVLGHYTSSVKSVVSVLADIDKHYSQMLRWTDYNLSEQHQKDAMFIGIYLMESFTNPHVTNMWGILRLANISIHIATIALNDKSAAKFNTGILGTTMPAKNLRNALEQLTNPTSLPENNSEQVDVSLEPNPAHIPEEVAVSPEDQKIIDDGAELSSNATQLVNSVDALENLRDQCKQLIKYGLPGEQRVGVARINATHRAICTGLGINLPSIIAVESEGGEEQALEGIFEAIGNTIKNVIQSVKNMWKSFVDRIKEGHLRQKAATGDLFARIELIKNKMHLLEQVKGEEFTDHKVIANIGLWKQFDTPIKAVDGMSALHGDYSKYINSSIKFYIDLRTILDKGSPETLIKMLVEDIGKFQQIVFPEKKNAHAVSPRMTKDQVVCFSRQIPGNSVPALIMPDEIHNPKYSGDRVTEISFVDLSSGIRSDVPKSIPVATVSDVADLEAAIHTWNERVALNADDWGYMISANRHAEDIANYIYQRIDGRQKESEESARMLYRYLAHFTDQVLSGFGARSAMTFSTFSAVMAWMEASIIKAENTIKSRPAVGN